MTQPPSDGRPEDAHDQPNHGQRGEQHFAPGSNQQGEKQPIEMRWQRPAPQTPDSSGAPEQVDAQQSGLQNEAPQNAAPQNSAPGYGAPHNGAPQNFAPESAAPQNATPHDERMGLGAHQPPIADNGSQPGDPQYGYRATQNPAGPRTGLNLNVPGMLITGGISAGVAVAALIVSSLIVTAILAGGLPTFVLTRATFDFGAIFGIIAGTAFFSPINAGASNLSVTATATIFAVPLAVTVIVLAATFITAMYLRNRALTTSIPERLITAGAVGFVVGIIDAICAAFGSTSIGPQNGGDAAGVWVGTVPVVAGFFAFILVAAAHAGGSFIASALPNAKSVLLPRVADRVPNWLRECATLIGWVSAFAGCAALLSGIVVLAISSTSGDPTPPSAAPLIAAYFVNFAGLLLGMFQLSFVSFRPFTDTSNYHSDTGVFSADGAWLWIGVLLLLVVMAVTAARIGLRRESWSRRQWQRAWILPLAWAGFMLVVQLVTAIRISMMTSSNVGSTGMTLSGFTFLIALLWGAAVEMGARYLPLVALAISPRFARILGGRRTHPSWFGMRGPWQGDAVQQPAPGAFVTFNASETGEQPTGSYRADLNLTTSYPTAAYPTGTASTAAGPFDAANPTFAAHREGGTEPQSWQSYDQQSPGPQPISKKARTRIILSVVAAGLALVLIIGGIVAVSIVNGMNSPEALAKKYAQAISDGDAETANSMFQPSAKLGDKALLNNEALKAAKERIKNIAVLSTRGSGDSREVALSYTLDGDRDSMTLRIDRIGKDFLFFDRWQLTSSAAQSIDVTSPANFTVDGKSMPATMTSSSSSSSSSDSAGTVKYAAYPAVYEFKGLDTKYLKPDKSAYRATLRSSGTSVSIQEIPTQQLLDDVTGKVNQWLRDCVQGGTSSLGDCPVGGSNTSALYTGSENVHLDTLKWSISQGVECDFQSGYSGSQLGIECGYPSAKVDVEYDYEYTSFDIGVQHEKTTVSVSPTVEFTKFDGDSFEISISTSKY